MLLLNNDVDFDLIDFINFKIISYPNFQEFKIIFQKDLRYLNFSQE